MKKLIYPLAIIFLMGCSDELIGIEEQFYPNQLEVLEELKKLDSFEDANFKSTFNNSKKSNSYHLKVYLKNGKNLNESNAFKKQIGKEAIKVILKSMDNNMHYSTFTVYFVTEKKYGETNMRSENPFSYQIDDFK